MTILRILLFHDVDFLEEVVSGLDSYVDKTLLQLCGMLEGGKYLEN